MMAYDVVDQNSNTNSCPDIKGNTHFAIWLVDGMFRVKREPHTNALLL